MSEDNKPKLDLERRKYKRVELITNVKYAVLVPKAFEEGLIQNISEGGLCLLLKKGLNVGDILHLEFQLPGDNPESIKTLVRVQWQLPKEGKFLVGVKFIT
ncbi:MAG: PilZ domain-containing protein [Candidatus Omnitrophica bacterium]|nr:PilZ domain-containing protein [Candidatus Omnitrophota bacterium]